MKVTLTTAAHTGADTRNYVYFRAGGHKYLVGSPANPLERFAVFFLLQRYLFKWGGERQPADGRHWRLFRELFLSVADQRVPVEFRPSDDHHRLRWRHHYRLRLRETIGFVRDIHERTGYRDARV